MLCEQHTVPMPESGIIKARTGKYRYVYKVLETFRNAKGQPTNKKTLIGREADDGRLIPNNRYYELYDAPKTAFVSAPKSVSSVGPPFLVTNILSRLGVTQTLEKVLGTKRAHEVITAASYMSCEGNVMAYLSDWCEESLIGMPALSSQRASELFASLSYDERLAFFKEWLVLNPGSGKVVHDVTCFSSYGRSILDLEWGYNRDGDKLRQVNLGCYLSKETGRPLFYVTYGGSITDTTHFPHMMAYNEILGIGDDIEYVLDRGFSSKENIKRMHAQGKKFILGIDKSALKTQQTIDGVKATIVSLKNEIDDEVFGVSVRSQFFDVPSVMHIYRSDKLQERHRRELFDKVRKLEEKLSELKVKSISKQLRNRYHFFDLDLVDGKLHYTRNYGKIDDATKSCGIFCILTNTEHTSAEILDIYRNKDVIEKAFDDIKNYVDMKRLRAHNDETIAGKIFCSFIALIATTVMTSTLRNFNAENKKRLFTKKGLINELKKIKAYSFPSGKRLLNPLSKTQKMLLDAFQINQAALMEFIT